MDERIQTIQYQTCYFGFSKLKGTGGLAPEVQRQLRKLGLAEGKLVLCSNNCEANLDLIWGPLKILIGSFADIWFSSTDDVEFL